MTGAEKEYGGALFSLAQDEHLEDTLLDGLTLVQQAFAENPSYPGLVMDPALSKEERLRLLDAAFGASVHPYVLNFTKILCEKSALGMVAGCAAQYRACLNEERGILPVTAQTAVPLTEQQMQKLAAQLHQKTGKTIQMKNVIDSSLMGGVKISYDGIELDGSVRHSLAALRAALQDDASEE